MDSVPLLFFIFDLDNQPLLFLVGCDNFVDNLVFQQQSCQKKIREFMNLKAGWI